MRQGIEESFYLEWRKQSGYHANLHVALLIDARGPLYLYTQLMAAAHAQHRTVGSNKKQLLLCTTQGPYHQQFEMPCSMRNMLFVGSQYVKWLRRRRNGAKIDVTDLLSRLWKLPYSFPEVNSSQCSTISSIYEWKTFPDKWQDDINEWD